MKPGVGDVLAALLIAGVVYVRMQLRKWTGR
jgi:hypothetical protein